MNKADKQVILVDDDPEEARLYKRFFERGALLKVKDLDLSKHPSLEDFRDLATDPKTGAFLIDQRLHEAGVEYTGSQLVRYLRQVKPELSIYMLTGFPKDVKATGDVEEVIDKKAVRSRTVQDHIKRILRSIRRYEDALSERQRRLDELIRLKLEGKLSKEQEDELNKIRAEIERPYGLELIRALDNRQLAIEDEMKMLQRISERLARIEPRSKHAVRKNKRQSPGTRNRKT